MAEKFDRRAALGVLGSLGIGSIAFQRALAKEAEKQAITEKMIADAEWVAGVELSEEQRRMAADALAKAQKGLQEFRVEELDNGLAPAFVFRPLEDRQPPATFKRTEVTFREASVAAKPETDEGLAFLPVSELSGLLRNRRVTSTELTKLYLARLKKFDPLLRCVVTLTEELALQQAAKVDREIQAGHYRGPLHGIPWGVKDLFALPGLRTTWGAPLYKERMLEEKAAVIQKLEDAGAVLIAKLTTGYFAGGDEWFGGKTRNPWNPSQGSSGSSAGSGAATAAGLVGFIIGTETMGSIISPAERCGVTGLRPTFGRVSRYGCMALAWTLDKVGPICRSVEDCAVVLGAIHGSDHRDPSSVNRNFTWPVAMDNQAIRIGYVKGDPEFVAEISLLRKLGFTMVPVEVEETPSEKMLPIILTTESGSLFDALTDQQEPKGVKFWPKTFVMGQFVTANDYIRANRMRRRVMEEVRELFREVDVVVGPSMSVATNMTGHPKIAVPRGFKTHEESKRQVPHALFMTGRLYDESTLVHVANAFQQATEHHLARPPIEDLLRDAESFHEDTDLASPGEIYTCE
ncbi:MAG: amidase [Planctomycetota bacterium]